MAAPAFGFSFGDFVSAINIVKDICRALRDTGRAKDKFQHVLIDLQHLAILLEQLNCGAWDRGGDAGHLNAIKGMALTCKQPLQEFQEKINKYKALEGTGVKNFRARLGGEARKIQWAVGMKEEVEKFRAVIVAKLISINLLIQLHTLSTISKLGSGAGPAAETVSLQTQIQGCRGNIQQLSSEMGKVTLEQIDMKESISKLVRICTGGKVGVEHFRNLNRAQHTEVQRRLNKLEKMHSQGHAIMVSNSEATKRQESVIRQLIFAFGGFSVVMLKILKPILRTNLEIYALLKEMHCTILHPPLFGNQNSIQFTDALGRTEPLPYQYFQHWDVFEAMLRCKFKQLPGEKLVEQGQYHLLDTKRKDLVIDRSRWERSVFPGADISMSMVILGMLFNKGSCPRIACGAPNSQQSIEGTFIICSKCNLEYRCLDASVQQDPILEEVVDRVGNSTSGGQDMFRVEGRRPEMETKFDNLDFSMPPKIEISVEEELEAFKSIHIQTMSRSVLSGEKPKEKNDNDTEIPPMVSEEKTDIPIPDVIASPPIPPDQPLGLPPTPESRIGIFLGKSLQIKGILGVGAYGVVYQAINYPDNTQYAIKALSKINLDGTPLDRRQREFQSREIQLHYAASAHPNVVSMLKIIDYPDCTYVILHYCPDGDLFADITERGLNVGNDDLIRTTFLQLLGAVQHCHNLGIYHRDLKPENILLDGTQVLLADFGLATTDPASEDHGCGSTFYMSPECLEDSGPYQCAPNDIWALGVILVNLTCGRNPWKQPSHSDSLYRAYLNNRNFLKSILPLSDELNDILVTVFEPEVEKRITIKELIIAVTYCPKFSQPLVAL